MRSVLTTLEGLQWDLENVLRFLRCWWHGTFSLKKSRRVCISNFTGCVLPFSCTQLIIWQTVSTSGKRRQFMALEMKMCTPNISWLPPREESCADGDRSTHVSQNRHFCMGMAWSVYFTMSVFVCGPWDEGLWQNVCILTCQVRQVCFAQSFLPYSEVLEGPVKKMLIHACGLLEAYAFCMPSIHDVASGNFNSQDTNSPQERCINPSLGTNHSLCGPFKLLDQEVQ